MLFSSLLIAAGTVAFAFAGPIAKQKRGKTFQFFGVNEAGAEFGGNNLPGVVDKDYAWPSTSSIDVGLELPVFLEDVLTRV